MSALRLIPFESRKNSLASNAMKIDHELKRAALVQKFHPTNQPAGSSSVQTGGVDHLALICSDIEQTIEFYTNIVGMTLNKILPNRDEPSSTHIFLDMGGKNFLAFFDFPKKGPAKTVRGVGSMHHLAMKASSTQLARIIRTLEAKGISYDLNGTATKGSVYFRDPDGILLEITTGY